MNALSDIETQCPMLMKAFLPSTEQDVDDDTTDLVSDINHKLPPQVITMTIEKGRSLNIEHYTVCRQPDENKEQDRDSSLVQLDAIETYTSTCQRRFSPSKMAN